MSAALAVIEWGPLHTWTVVIGVLCAASCAIPGALLVLRRMSMMGDAISHAVLPGLAIAFLITHSRDPLTMFLGATIIGIVTAFAVESVQKLGGTDSGTAMGVVFTTLFALGMILIRQALDHVHLDADCVLYGDIGSAATDAALSDTLLSHAVIVNGGMLLVNALLVTLLYKEFKISSFDEALATTQGINATLMHYLLMTMTAATTVAAFETVGSILVIAMLIVPGATAYLLTDRFGVMLVLSVALGALAAVSGHVAAITVPTWFGFEDTLTSASMAFMSGVIFLVVWVVAPRHGLANKFIDRARLSLRILREDALGLLYRLEELHMTERSVMAPKLLREAMGATALGARLALLGLVRSGQVRHDDEGYALTEVGRRRARSLVRTHRLWESYLAEEGAIAPEDVHAEADRLEHAHELADKVAARLGHPDRDPHGEPIPGGK